MLKNIIAMLGLSAFAMSVPANKPMTTWRGKTRRNAQGMPGDKLARKAAKGRLGLATIR